jgi:DNA-binding MarR family transcriptional regulator
MPGRRELEALIAADVRILSVESERIGQTFAGRNELGANDFRALMHVMAAEDAEAPLTAGDLSRRMGISGAAITYLVERLIRSGHIRRESDPGDRRKVIVRYADHGMSVARAFFTPLAGYNHAALAELPDSDLAAAHRVFTAVTAALRSFADELDGG